MRAATCLDGGVAGLQHLRRHSTALNTYGSTSWSAPVCGRFCSMMREPSSDAKAPGIDNATAARGTVVCCWSWSCVHRLAWTDYFGDSLAGAMAARFWWAVRKATVIHPKVRPSRV